MTFPNTSRQPEDRGYLPTLDGWRAVAVCGVMLCHLGKERLVADGFSSPALVQLAEAGRYGVDLFFGISGFLITSRLLRERDAKGSFSLREFYLRRAFRILPASWAYLVVLSGLAAAGALSAVAWREIVSSLLFFRNYLPYLKVYDENWYTGHFWSLAVEEHYYLLWPLALTLISPAALLRGLPWAALSIAGWRALNSRVPALGIPHVELFFRSDIRMDALLWSSWLAILVRDPAHAARLRRWLTPGAWAVIALAVLLTLPMRIPVLGLVRPLLIPLVIFGTVAHPRRPFSRFLEWAPLRWLGRISYSLYLWHMLFVVAYPANRIPGVAWLQGWPWCLPASLCVAWLSYIAIEKPMIRLGQRWMAKDSLQAAERLGAAS